MRSDAGDKAGYRTWRSIKTEGGKSPLKILSTASKCMREELEQNRTIRRAETSQRYLSQSLNPTGNQGCLSSGSDIQTEIKALVRKGKLVSGVIEKNR